MDPELGLLLVAMDGDEVQAEWPGMKQAVQADGPYVFDQPVQVVQTGLAYPATNGQGLPCTVYFTNLPVLQITTFGEVVDEPRVPALFSMWSQGQALQDRPIGIEVRGGSSQALPKKSFLIEFRNAEDTSQALDVSLLGMRNDDDWNLQAMYREPLRLRSVVAQELWMDLYGPYYLFLENHAMSGVHHQYAELFLNGNYRGLYAVGERVDRKQLQLMPSVDEYHGELFKGESWGASTFTSVPPIVDPEAEYWGGFRNIYPEDDPDWTALAGFVDLVVNGADQDFRDHVEELFYRPNAVDYLLFLNVLRALDNAGKNLFVARYDAHEPYFYVPWDLDGIMGVAWDGSPDPDVSMFLSNGLFDRWLDDLSWGGFRQACCQRWEELRQGTFTVAHIMQRFQERHAQLQASGVYAREELAWPDYQYDAAHLDYMEQWLAQRLAFLDMEMAQSCAALGSGELASSWKPLLFPNPAVAQVHVEWPITVPITRLVVLNALGAQVMAQPVSGGNTILDLPPLAPGVYEVVLVDRDAVLVRSPLMVQQ